MKKRRIRINGFLIITALTVIGCCVGLTARRGAIADSAKNVATPMPTLHGRAAFRHLEQTGLRNSLWAAVNAARYGVEPQKGGGYETANLGQKYRTIYTPQGMDETAVYPVTIYPTLSQEAKLTAGDAASDDQFGAAVGISGETAVIGAPVDDTDAGPQVGSAYVFVRSGTGWSQQAKLTASDAAAGDIFGFSVAVIGDTVVVGASGDNMLAGSAYVFVRSGTSWSQQAKLTASDATSGDRFGDAVGISGDTVVVGATDAASDAGAAYVFVRSGTTWSQQAKLTASDAAVFDLFGFSVAIIGDTAVIGAPSDDTDAGHEAGSAYVFARSGTSWSQQAKLTASDAAAGDTFGLSVAVSGDTAVVGALDDDTDAGPDAGSAYVFARSGTSWSQQAKLTASDASGGVLFGRAVAVSGDTAVVGAQFGGDIIAGSAYVFVRSGTSWSQRAKLTASDAAAFDFFGRAVAISGDTVVVGALADDTDAGTNAGSAYVFAPANQPPDCSGAFPSVSTIWPPNHDMINVTIQGVTDPDGDPVTINIDQIKQDEPTDGTGDGHTCPDGAGIGTSTAQVRAERSAHGDGRVYTIYFTASDGNGGSCQGSGTVCVPKSRNGSCTNGGAIYDSTQCDTSLNWQSGDNVTTHWPSAGESAYWKNYCLLDGILHLLLDDPPCMQ